MANVTQGRKSTSYSADDFSVNTDAKVTADGNAVIVGAGGSLDASTYSNDQSSVKIVTDNSTQTTIIDESAYNYSFADNSDNSDNSDNRQFYDNSDNSQFTDNSITTTLDADVATAAINGVVDVSIQAGELNADLSRFAIGSTNAAAIRLGELGNEFAEDERAAAYGLSNFALGLVQTNTAAVLDATLTESDANRQFQSKFIGDFYESQQDSSERITSDLVSTAQKIALAALAAYTLRSFAKR
jgi:hypothetical protein